MHSTRYAHCEGYTDICFAEQGKFLTTGEDGDVRIWQSFDDTDSMSIRVGDKCSAVAYREGKIYVADELNELKKYDLKTNEFEGVITSFTLPITCIAINKSNTFLVCGSADFEIHLVDLKTLKFTAFPGHDGPILSLTFDPLEKYFVSASCDGTVRFWSTQNLICVKTLHNLHAKSNDFEDSVSRCKVAWHKDGGLIAVPCEKEIHFFERETWICKFKINLQENDNLTTDFNASIVCFSPDGQHVLASTSTQMVYIHSIINKALVFKYSYTKSNKFCSIAWNSSNTNEILFCDYKGNMGQIKATLKDDLTSSITIKSTTSTTKSATSKKEKKESTKHQDDELEMEDLLDLLDNDSNDSDGKSSKNDLKSPSKKRKRISEDNGDNEDDAASEKSTKSSVRTEDADDGEDDMVSLEKLKMKTFKTVKKDILSMEQDGDLDAAETASSIREERVNIDEILKRLNTTQPAFQPSSTLLSLPERYMCWNSVGMITQFNKESDESIDIEFHNATYHHTIHLKNQYGYTMADMSKEAIILASPGQPKDEENELNIATTSQSKLTCILLNSFDNTKEWMVDMLRKEYIKCVCASKYFVACATSRKFLRVYGLAGTQLELICIPGTPVCMSAYENALFVCYYISNSTIGYSIYYINDHLNKEAEHGILPLSDAAKLEWIGFSDEGNPYCLDSNGYLYAKCWTVSKVNTWTPLSHLKPPHKSDSYWLVGISERNQMIKTILCRCSKYPQVLPRPTLTLLNVNMPFTETESEKTLLEQEYRKNNYFSISIKNYNCSSGNIDFDQDELDEMIEKYETNSSQTLMKLFMLACKSSKEQRAYEVANLMNSVSLQLAIKYATKTRALVLAQNLNLLAERKAMFEYEKMRYEEEQQSNSRAYQTMTVQNNHQPREQMETNSHQNVDTDVEIVDAQENAKSHKKPNDFSETQEIENTLNKTDYEQTLTPSAIPLTTTRINPFLPKNKGTPLNDASKSIINEIEEKINKQSASKEKDTWKPTPTRGKLTKSKLSSNSTPTSTLNSFIQGKNNN